MVNQYRCFEENERRDSYSLLKASPKLKQVFKKWCSKARCLWFSTRVYETDARSCFLFY
jgi:hypothetical protein